MGKKVLLLALATATLVMAGCKNVSSDDADTDTASLVAVVTDATALQGATTVGTAAGNVSQADKDAYAAAIAAAQAVINNGAATQAEIDAAVNALERATAAFRAAIVTRLPVDKTALAQAITDASALQGATTVGSAAGNVSLADKDAYAAAIAAAQAVSDNAAATQAEIDAAVTALAHGTASFRAAIVTQVYKAPYGSVYDCQWDVSVPSVFSATSFGYPYDLEGHHWMVEFETDVDTYIGIDIKTASDGDTITCVSLDYYAKDGTFIRRLCNSGKILYLGTEGFLYTADDTFLGYFFTRTAHDYEDKVTYTYTVPAVTRKSELVR